MFDKTDPAMSDIRYMVRSKVLLTPADGTYLVCALPKNAFVHNVYVDKTTAYSDVSALLEVGFTGNGETDDTDAFMINSDVDPAVTGIVNMVGGNSKNEAGKWFGDQGGGVTVTVDDNGGTAGTFQVFVDYSILF